MNLLEAVNKAEHNDNIKKLKGYFLGSSFASLYGNNEGISEWTLLYYNPENKSVVDCVVNDKFITVGEATAALKEIEEIHITDVGTDIGTVLKNLEKQLKQQSIGRLISLHKKNLDGKWKLVWTVAFITQSMEATSFDVDAVSGKVLKEEKTSLIRKVEK